MNNFFKAICFAMPAFAFWSCNDDKSITLSESGKLNVNISLEGNGVTDAIVDLYDIEGELLYDRKKTNGNGSAEFGRYNSNDYLLKIEATSDKEFFQFQKPVQVISDNTKNLDIHLEDYYVPVDVKVIDALKDEPLSLSGYSSICPI